MKKVIITVLIIGAWITGRSNSGNPEVVATYRTESDGQTVGQTEVQQEETFAPETEVTQANQGDGRLVWLTATGSKYHSINNCGRTNPANAYQVTEDEAIAQGYGKCKKCW